MKRFYKFLVVSFLLSYTTQSSVFAQSQNYITQEQLGQQEIIIRDLTGKVEELTFEIQKLKDEMKLLKKDNEFRFNELEQKVFNEGDTAAPQQSDDDANVETTEPETEEVDPNADEDPVIEIVPNGKQVELRSGDLKKKLMEI
jgi:TolA-binding protein